MSLISQQKIPSISTLKQSRHGTQTPARLNCRGLTRDPYALFYPGPQAQYPSPCRASWQGWPRNGRTVLNAISALLPLNQWHAFPFHLLECSILSRQRIHLLLQRSYCVFHWDRIARQSREFKVSGFPQATLRNKRTSTTQRQSQAVFHT